MFKYLLQNSDYIIVTNNFIHNNEIPYLSFITFIIDNSLVIMQEFWPDIAKIVRTIRQTEERRVLHRMIIKAYLWRFSRNYKNFEIKL